MLQVELKFVGNLASQGEIELYDVAQAIIGFQRTLALTTHAVINAEVITQAPSLRGAKILALPPEEGSWKIIAALVGGIWAGGQASHDSVVGHLLYSAYDYVISESLGVHVNFDESLGQTIERAREANLSVPKISESRLDSVQEKCEASIKLMHRPMVAQESAESAEIYFRGDGIGHRPISTNLDFDTYEYIARTHERPKSREHRGGNYILE